MMTDTEDDLEQRGYSLDILRLILILLALIISLNI